MARKAVIHAYRHLLRHSLRAIQFSKPARYTLRDRLRLAFRKSTPVEYDQVKINNTIEFLQYATRENGLEHKIVKNLLFVWWTQSHGGRAKQSKKAMQVSRLEELFECMLTKYSLPEELEIKTIAYDAFNYNVRMLNESMRMCIPAMTVRDPI